nr:immunoglobulin heavy chain junction region [Macaca mulatta]MOW23165.1 immunoglobulin heavy chain junction region [Macaca mulatta]MOW23450.1 immunoglobulin heavy chain junction region [Macaca mulatta]MOW23823.1 immunoglobulin heavy chain junction region [Macaca mulatta]MOW23938.1 immunoglobulin heavy chain junction region [Macaca mulatta]
CARRRVGYWGDPGGSLDVW